MQCAIRRRLGIASCVDGPDPHGHAKLTNRNGRNARHITVVSAWRQVFIEAGGFVPDRNVERLLSSTHVRVPRHDMRRMDLVMTG